MTAEQRAQKMRDKYKLLDMEGVVLKLEKGESREFKTSVKLASTFRGRVYRMKGAEFRTEMIDSGICPTGASRHIPCKYVAER